MNKINSFLITFLCFYFPTYGTIVNEVIVSVGDRAITTYDIEEMREFDSHFTQKKLSAEEALKKLIFLCSLLIIGETKKEYQMDEQELRRYTNSIQNGSDAASKERAALYKKYPQIYKMIIRSDKVKQGLIHGDIQIKTAINQNISSAESETFYKRNKTLFKDSPFPKLDLIIFAVESSPKWTLSELESVEKSMQNLAQDLSKENNFNALKKKYSKLKFTNFSGNTGLYTPDILILQKKIPDEIIGIALLKDTLDLGPTKIPIRKNKGIYIPQPIPFQSTGKSTYLSFKILKIIEPEQLSFEQALPRIEETIKIERSEKEINKLIKKRIKDGLITLTPTGTGYSKVFKEFN